MALPFTCPKCAQKMSLTSSKPGDWIDCPNCEATVQIPGAVPAPARTPAPPPAVLEDPDESEPAPTRGLWSDNRVRIGAAAGVAALLVVGAIGFIVARPSKPQAETAAVTPAPAAPAPASPTPPVRVVPPPAPVPPTTPKADPPVKGPVARVEQAPPPHVKQPRTPSRVVMLPVPVAHGEARPLKLGVSTRGADDIGAILTSLGKGYAFTTLAAADWEDAERLKEYDVVFLNCAAKIGTPMSVSKALREFVAAGKTLYASDQQCALVGTAFPESADAGQRARGELGKYEAEVLDKGLQAVLGKTVDLSFNVNGWQAAAFGGANVTTILRAGTNARLKKGTPLLVKFPHGQGTVFFTSFHNSAIADDTAKKLLRHLVFSTVVADAEARINAVLARDKYGVKSSEILTAAADDWSAERTHTLGKGETFRVAVGFHNDSAEVLLTVTSPEGEDVTFEREGKNTFVIDLINAPAGEWKLKVTARKIPYPNFPITLVVAEPK